MGPGGLAENRSADGCSRRGELRTSAARKKFCCHLKFSIFSRACIPESRGFVLPGFLWSINSRADSTFLPTLVSPRGLARTAGYSQTSGSGFAIANTPSRMRAPLLSISRNQPAACSDFTLELCSALSKGQKCQADTLSLIRCPGQPG